MRLPSSGDGRVAGRGARHAGSGAHVGPLPPGPRVRPGGVAVLPTAAVPPPAPRLRRHLGHLRQLRRLRRLRRGGQGGQRRTERLVKLAPLRRLDRAPQSAIQRSLNDGKARHLTHENGTAGRVALLRPPDAGRWMRVGPSGRLRFDDGHRRDGTGGGLLSGRLIVGLRAGGRGVRRKRLVRRAVLLELRRSPAFQLAVAWLR